jgi:hypothetical protein
LGLEQENGKKNCVSSPKFASQPTLTIPFSGPKTVQGLRPYLPTSSTGIDEIKQLSIIVIYTIFVILILPLPNTCLPQGEVIPATKLCRARQIGAYGAGSPGSSSPAATIKIMRPVNCFCKHPVRFSLIRTRGFGIYHSIVDAIHVRLVYLTYNIALSSHVFIWFEIILGHFLYGYCKFAAKFKAGDGRSTPERRGSNSKPAFGYARRPESNCVASDLIKWWP